MNEKIQSTHQTPGPILKAARESRKLSVNEVAQSLLLSKRTVAALEDDDYRNIVAQVYAEGYLKAYAKFLHIEVDIILDGFRQLGVYSVQETGSLANGIGKGNKWEKIILFFKNKKKKIFVSCVFVLLVFGALVFYFTENVGKKAEAVDLYSVSDVNAVSESQPTITLSNKQDTNNQKPNVQTNESAEGEKEVIKLTN